MVNDNQLKILDDALHYLRVAELKDLCNNLKLPDQGTKAPLIKRIIHFVKTGMISTTPIPPISLAKKGLIYPLEPQTDILKGAYKNDLATRLFFKKLIGPHFHFTAFGIDWLNERWQAGNPPTYAEFASFWQKENLRRSKTKIAPKAEWAYINFLQKYAAHYPKSSPAEAKRAWFGEQTRQKRIAIDLLRPFLK